MRSAVVLGLSLEELLALKLKSMVSNNCTSPHWLHILAPLSLINAQIILVARISLICTVPDIRGLLDPTDWSRRRFSASLIRVRALHLE
jgi:hypothetical protein